MHLLFEDSLFVGRDHNAELGVLFNEPYVGSGGDSLHISGLNLQRSDERMIRWKLEEDCIDYPDLCLDIFKMAWIEVASALLLAFLLINLLID